MNVTPEMCLTIKTACDIQRRFNLNYSGAAQVFAKLKKETLSGKSRWFFCDRFSRWYGCTHRPVKINSDCWEIPPNAVCIPISGRDDDGNKILPIIKDWEKSLIQLVSSAPNMGGEI